MIRQLNPFTHIPKGLSGRTFADTIINQQVYRSPAPEVKDILFSARGHICIPAEGPGLKYSKTELCPLTDDVVENKKYLTENPKSPISLSVNFNTPINNYQAPLCSPLFTSEDGK